MNTKYLRKRCYNRHDMAPGQATCGTCGSSDRYIRCPACGQHYEDFFKDHIRRCFPVCTSIIIYEGLKQVYQSRPNVQFLTYEDLIKTIPSDILIPNIRNHVFEFPTKIDTPPHMILLEYRKYSVYDYLQAYGHEKYYRDLYPNIIQVYDDIPELHMRKHSLPRDIAIQLVNNWKKPKEEDIDIRCTIQ